MAIKNKPIVTRLTVSAQSIVTASSGRDVIIAAATATNVGVADATVTIHLVPSGGVVDDTNKVIADLSITSGQARNLNALNGLGLQQGGQLFALSDTADSINLSLNPVDVF